MTRARSNSRSAAPTLALFAPLLSLALTGCFAPKKAILPTAPPYSPPPHFEIQPTPEPPLLEATQQSWQISSIVPDLNIPAPKPPTPPRPIRPRPNVSPPTPVQAEGPKIRPAPLVPDDPNAPGTDTIRKRINYVKELIGQHPLASLREDSQVIQKRASYFLDLATRALARGDLRQADALSNRALVLAEDSSRGR